MSNVLNRGKSACVRGWSEKTSPQNREAAVDKQRRYEARNIAVRLDKLVSELKNLADEEESAFNSRPAGSQWNVSGQDSKEAYEEMRSAAAAISLQAEKLYEIGEPRPKSTAG
jgi:hypothetical protein